MDRLIFFFISLDYHNVYTRGWPTETQHKHAETKIDFSLFPRQRRHEAERKSTDMRDSASQTPAPLRRNLARASSPCPVVVEPCPSLEPLPRYGGAPAQASSPCHVRMQPCPSLKPLPCYYGALPEPQAPAPLQCCPCPCPVTMPLPCFSGIPALSSLQFSPTPAPPLLQWCCL